MRHLFFVLALLCTALSAGIFYAFSTIVMPGLDLGGALSAIHAMQGINTVVRNALFAAVFFGALVIPLLAALGARSAGHRGAARQPRHAAFPGDHRRARHAAGARGQLWQ